MFVGGVVLRQYLEMSRPYLASQTWLERYQIVVRRSPANVVCLKVGGASFTAAAQKSSLCKYFVRVLLRYLSQFAVVGIFRLLTVSVYIPRDS